MNVLRKIIKILQKSLYIAEIIFTKRYGQKNKLYL